jgi:hypothetical protein
LLRRWQATRKALQSSYITWSIFAPWAINSSTIVPKPFMQATCNGVHPLMSGYCLSEKSYRYREIVAGTWHKYTKNNKSTVFISTYTLNVEDPSHRLFCWQVHYELLIIQLFYRDHLCMRYVEPSTRRYLLGLP